MGPTTWPSIGLDNAGPRPLFLNISKLTFRIDKELLFLQILWSMIPFELRIKFYMIDIQSIS